MNSSAEYGSGAIRGACVAVPWFAIGRVADIEGDGLRILGVALALAAAAELGCGSRTLLTGLFVGLLVMVFTDSP